MSENKGVKCECKKFGENSRQMAPVSTICDEYCSTLRNWEVVIDIIHVVTDSNFIVDLALQYWSKILIF